MLDRLNLLHRVSAPRERERLKQESERGSLQFLESPMKRRGTNARGSSSLV